MTNANKLVLLKFLHTIIWVFYSVVIFYMLYAVIIGKIDQWLWIGYGLVGIECIILLSFKFFCPITIIARRYSNSTKDNFDIYLPNWLAKNNKLIYSIIMVIIVLMTIYRVL